MIGMMHIYYLLKKSLSSTNLFFECERCGQVGSNDCVAYKPNDFTINNVGWDQYGNKEPIVAIGSYSAQVKFLSLLMKIKCKSRVSRLIGIMIKR